jgi:hypothetical protein
VKGEEGKDQSSVSSGLESFLNLNNDLVINIGECSSCNPKDGFSKEHVGGISPDKERQMLLLMLLAQVCSLHDVTPRTFTVHVFNLLERGVIDKENFSFLFGLGLVDLKNLKDRLIPYIQYENNSEKLPSVSDYPLSLSRYEREFLQVSLINSGSFGSVFHVRNNLDGRSYAIKKVIFRNIGFDTSPVQYIMREVQSMLGAM